MYISYFLWIVTMSMMIKKFLAQFSKEHDNEQNMLQLYWLYGCIITPQLPFAWFFWTLRHLKSSVSKKNRVKSMWTPFWAILSEGKLLQILSPKKILCSKFWTSIKILSPKIWIFFGLRIFIEVQNFWKNSKSKILDFYKKY